MRRAIKRLTLALIGAVGLVFSPILTAPASADAVGGGCSPSVTQNFWGAFETTHLGCTTPRSDSALLLQRYLRVTTPAPSRMGDCAVVARVHYDNGAVVDYRTPVGFCPRNVRDGRWSNQFASVFRGCHYYYIEWYPYVVFDGVAYYGQLTAGGHQYICV